MANEAVIIELGYDQGRPVRRTCATGTSISKGTLLVLSDPNTAAASASGNKGVPFAGIAAADKLGGDGSTSIAAYTNGVFDLTLASGGACAVGEMVTISGANTIDKVTGVDISQMGILVGKAEEIGTTGEVVRVRLLGI